MPKNFSKKMLWLKDNVIAVSIDDKAMVIDLSNPGHFTLGPETGCFILRVLARPRGDEVTFEELVDCVNTQFNFEGTGETAETGVANFLKLLADKRVLKTGEARRSPVVAKSIIGDVEGKKAWKKAGFSGKGSWIWWNPPWYP